MNKIRDELKAWNGMNKNRNIWNTMNKNIEEMD